MYAERIARIVAPHPVLEGLALLAVTLPIALGFNIATLWLVIPIVWLSLLKRPLEDYTLCWDWPGEWRFHASLSLIVFIPYCVVHWLLAAWLWDARLTPRLPGDLAAEVVYQIFVIALPEETFFRGYLQTQFDRAFGRPWHLFGANIGLGLPLAAALFAACHIFHGGPARLIVFFPGMLYGWLRARSTSIVVPTMYHAVSNLLMTTMIVSLGPDVP